MKERLSSLLMMNGGRKDNQSHRRGNSRSAALFFRQPARHEQHLELRLAHPSPFSLSFVNDTALSNGARVPPRGTLYPGSWNVGRTGSQCRRGAARGYWRFWREGAPSES
ncbi:hypothetical protein AX14_000668 [Amanita brunnescens Koide BX004]|nr:hypothetical protein AX14_000668 [Amanita brunnescens Koide BX004]